MYGVQMSKFPNHKVVSTDSLIPYAMNSRTHSEQQVSQIAASIKEFGFLNPIIVDGENGIIAGHGRVMAAKKLGMAEVPVAEAKHLSEAQKKAYVIADNRLALNAEWDAELLKAEINNLHLEDFDIELLGFDSQELAIMFDDIPEPTLTEEKYSEVFNVIVECADEQEQEKVFNRLDTEGYKCRVQSL